jgi:hypothetical protein
MVQVLDMALHENGRDRNISLPEKNYIDARKLKGNKARSNTLLFLGLVAMGVIAYRFMKKPDESVNT